MRVKPKFTKCITTKPLCSYCGITSLYVPCTFHGNLTKIQLGSSPNSIAGVPSGATINKLCAVPLTCKALVVQAIVYCFLLTLAKIKDLTDTGLGKYYSHTPG